MLARASGRAAGKVKECTLNASGTMVVDEARSDRTESRKKESLINSKSSPSEFRRMLAACAEDSVCRRTMRAASMSEKLVAIRRGCGAAKVGTRDPRAGRVVTTGMEGQVSPAWPWAFEE
jgi:nucleoid DNA-binding protein